MSTSPEIIIPTYNPLHLIGAVSWCTSVLPLTDSLPSPRWRHTKRNCLVRKRCTRGHAAGMGSCSHRSPDRSTWTYRCSCRGNWMMRHLSRYHLHPAGPLKLQATSLIKKRKKSLCASQMSAWALSSSRSHLNSVDTLRYTSHMTSSMISPSCTTKQPPPMKTSQTPPPNPSLSPLARKRRGSVGPRNRTVRRSPCS